MKEKSKSYKIDFKGRVIIHHDNAFVGVGVGIGIGIESFGDCPT